MKKQLLILLLMLGAIMPGVTKTMDKFSLLLIDETHLVPNGGYKTSEYAMVDDEFKPDRLAVLINNSKIYLMLVEKNLDSPNPNIDSIKMNFKHCEKIFYNLYHEIKTTTEKEKNFIKSSETTKKIFEAKEKEFDEIKNTLVKLTEKMKIILEKNWKLESVKSTV